MKVFIASDHAAVNEKAEVIKHIEKYGEIIDLGPSDDTRVNYPDFAGDLCKNVITDENAKGILLCGSGIGMSMVANRYKGIRAALCKSTEDASLSVQHNNANVLCLGARTTDIDLIKKICDCWFEAEFEGGRHQTRIDLFTNMGIDP